MFCHDACGTLVLQLLLYGLANGAVIALNAVGFTLAYAAARQINLAHGNVFVLTSVVVAALARLLGVTAATPLGERIGALLLLCLVGALCGALLNGLVERLAFRPFRGSRDRLVPLIATVALSMVLLGLAVHWPRPPARPYHQGVDLPMLALPDLIPAVELGWGGVSFTTKDAMVLLLSALVTAGVAALLARTRVGRLLRAISQDGELAALCGANPDRAQLLAFALAGALAGFGAAIFSAYYGLASSDYGLRSGLATITAAVLGGVGDPRGALLSGLAIGVFSSLSDYLLTAHWTPVLVLILLILLLALAPTGLLRSGAGSEGEDLAPSAQVAVAGGSRAGSRWLLVGLGALGAAYPLLDALLGWHRLYSAAPALLLVTLAVGLSVVVGFAGLLDLGYAAFFAIGGYTAALLTASGSRLVELLPALAREPWLAIPLAGVMAAGFGVLFGLPSLRTRGEYLAIVTLAFGEIVPTVIRQTPDWTNGPRGISGIPGLHLGPWAPSSPLHAYLVALALAIVACLVAARLAEARIGRAWAAVRDDEIAASAAGVNPPRAKLLAFAIGAGYAGVAGAIYAGMVSHIEPEQFDFTLSIMVLAAVVIGGRWGLPGVVLGALAVACYDRLLVSALNGALHSLGATLGLAGLLAADLREDNFLVFGLALYLAILPRARRGAAAPRPLARLLPRWGLRPSPAPGQRTL